MSIHWAISLAAQLHTPSEGSSQCVPRSLTLPSTTFLLQQRAITTAFEGLLNAGRFAFGRTAARAGTYLFTCRRYEANMHSGHVMAPY